MSGAVPMSSVMRNVAAASAAWWCLASIGLMSLTVGCSNPEVAATNVADSQAAFDRAMAAMATENYAAARPDFDLALKAGGLIVDNYVDALLNRSLCLSAAGEYEAAAADIATAEQGATELDKVHVARGFMLAKQGDSTGAQAAFAEAKKINPKVLLPTL